MVVVGIYVVGLILMITLLNFTKYNPEFIMTLGMLWPFVLIYLIGFWIKETF